MSVLRRLLFAPAMERAAVAGVVLLLPCLLYARAGCEILVGLTGLVFLARSAAAGAWGWTAWAWVRLAALFWAWLVACSLLAGEARGISQSLVLLRLGIYVAALQFWVLATPGGRAAAGLAVRLTAGWVALEAWQQYLTGTNIFGAPRWVDGALTGPFAKPMAGATLMQLFFPALLPPALALLGRADWRARLAGGALLAGGLVTVVLIGQRMPALLTLFGLVVAALLVRRLRLAVLLAIGLGAVVLAASPVISPATYGKLVLRFAEQLGHFADSPYGRLFVRAGEMIAAHPLLGLGFDGFRLHCGEAAYQHGLPWLGLAGGDWASTDGCNLHPHNYWLDVAVSGGLPALGLFAGLVGAWLWRLFDGLFDGSGPPAMRAALAVAVVVSFWPLASTSALFTFPTAGWVFLLVGWGLAESDAAKARG